ncbi:winged helix-turn-helix domain-containing protein [Streptomyces sp. NPDC031705]|uniref:winged helix-turn-helix domain-containing protein n=1 Tax=unclassified Streptomyces TaxID=2593676 RepID=UPI0033F495C3
MSTTPDKDKVRIVRWPLETAKREKCRELGALRILLVENGATPPLTADLREDWVRAPVSREDLEARVMALRAKAGTYRVPTLGVDGELQFDGGSVVLSPTEVAIVAELVRNYGSLVARESLAHLTDASRASRNALDLHMMRIRRRIAPLGLGISTAWGRGYLLQELTQGMPGQAGRAQTANGALTAG